MDEKKRILKALAATAKELGRTPSHAEFLRRARVKKSAVRREFSKWNEAVRAAGLKPARIFRRLDKNQLLEDWGKTVRKLGRVPSRAGYSRAGRHDPVSLEVRFGWDAVPQAFRNYARGRPEWRDVLELINTCERERRMQESRMAVRRSMSRKSRREGLNGGIFYGDPMDFHGLRHEPVNEQGVVLLFGMLAQEMGYLVESVQMGFPDCEAKRKIGPGRWQRVRIEFEFESRGFRQHKHPVAGCDVIVCWRHNWEECPKSIEVIELASVIRPQLPASENGSPDADVAA
ncbi:MAG TPA: hypothetical protein VFO34_12295 [Candidatus Acidoferrales bacterium]|nr:hypothetical protein [Candidatus Acidoferrales bacterium]